MEGLQQVVIDDELIGKMRKEAENSEEAALKVGWPYKISTYSPSEVHDFCVLDRAWQAFRLGLKGSATHQKLKLLAMRRSQVMSNHNGKLPRKYEVQIDNYLNALKRGGQLSIDGKIQR